MEGISAFFSRYRAYCFVLTYCVFAAVVLGLVILRPPWLGTSFTQTWRGATILGTFIFAVILTSAVEVDDIQAVVFERQAPGPWGWHIALRIYQVAVIFLGALWFGLTWPGKSSSIGDVWAGMFLLAAFSLRHSILAFCSGLSRNSIQHRRTLLSSELPVLIGFCLLLLVAGLSQLSPRDLDYFVSGAFAFEIFVLNGSFCLTNAYRT